jgi:hypothetical protein
LKAITESIKAERYLGVAFPWWGVPVRFAMEFRFKLFVVFKGIMIFNSKIGFDVDISFETGECLAHI